MAPPCFVAEPDREKALLIGVVQRGHREQDVVDSLEELAQLSRTAGADVADRLICRQMSPNAATYIGKGKALQIAGMVREKGITTLVFDDDLSPGQGRNLEAVVPAKIIDRTQMILDIFARHAHTREGSLQIELAQLQYVLPRLKRMWTHLERQKGGIGLRGPGEKQLELDRRRIQERIGRLRKDLEQVRGRRAEQRRGRRRHGWALVTLVGYTNAGKSTLLNALTGAQVEAVDQLFATLDPTTRRLELPNRQHVLLTDTVGFIRKLPHHLVESFKATLEEVQEADLLLHVIDAAHPQVEAQMAAVTAVLKEIGAENKPILPVFNKLDEPLAQAQAARLVASDRRGVRVSALKREGLDELTHALADCLRDRTVAMRVALPQQNGRLLAQFRSQGHVYSETYEDDRVLIEGTIPLRFHEQFKPYEQRP